MKTPAETGFTGDTSPEALRARYAALRRMTPRERLAMMDDLTRLVQNMTREGLRRRHPEATGAELDVLYCEIVHGRELAAKVMEHRRSHGPSSEP